MPLVVSDTSPIRALHHLGLVELLRDLFEDVVVPTAVLMELRRGSKTFPPIDLAAYGFIRILAPTESDKILDAQPNLDPGEAAAIALALEIRADEVLMDEKLGRQVAEDLGIRTVGVLGILIRAKDRGFIPQIRPLVDRIRNEINFFLSDSLYYQVMKSVGE